jgi:hypothetical protein
MPDIQGAELINRCASAIRANMPSAHRHNKLANASPFFIKRMGVGIR